MIKRTKYRFLFAGGGTGGHLFPAIAVAEKIKELKPESEILFIGTKNKIESKVVPSLGFDFKTIWIKGFSRKQLTENLLFPIKVLVSLIQSIIISMKFKPTVAIGSGGYVSGPAIIGASVMGAKIILLEQNSYPGITTRLLEKKANEVHLNFEDSKKYMRFENKLFITGNPVRNNLKLIDKDEALKYFNMKSDKKTLLIIGGSLGAAAINVSIASLIPKLIENNIQLIWQTGKIYFEKFKSLKSDSIWIGEFIDRMDLAYSSADLVLSRAGATTISEISLLGIPSILIPSPNVAENHQFHNAKSLVDGNAVLMIEEKEINIKLFDTILETINNYNVLKQLSFNIKQFAKPEAASIIAERAIKLVA